MPTEWRRDLVTALIGLWIVVGVHFDGWAHVHVLNLIDDFFTPWHASFYSGLAAFAAWLGIIALRIRRPGDTAFQTFQRLPLGYRGGAIGVAIFAASGAIDLLWHELIGIEASIDALLSPPHLGLMTGVLLMGTSAWRSQRALSATATIPELVSLTSAVMAAGFFLNPLSPFRWAAPATGFQPYDDDYVVVMWLGGVLVSTGLLLIPTLWQVRDGRHRVGTLTTLTVAVGLGTAIAMSEHWKMSVLIPGVIAAGIGALAGDLIIAQVPWRDWRYGLPIVAGLSAFLIWTFQLIAYATTAGVLWPESLWGGSLLFAAGTGAALGSLLWRPSRHLSSPPQAAEPAYAEAPRSTP
ncbi:hypothetical protein Rhe02_27150 [Rhizocola hellebori]|uniref:Uncharacterized protein n=1 Tax=Rhizocola hellebori TaxID=1392758 RepID=A0A8J3VG98_9ACTN|nr:hypothetical protein [Rhizocola hellebori]GIH04648.1 hypothetical protein Rhe02_27150 [Rhizocola hellebori]